MKKDNIKVDASTGSDLKEGYNFRFHPRDSKITTDKKFVKLENCNMGSIHWTCFNMKDNISSYIDSPGSFLDEFLLQQLPKPITFQSWRVRGRKRDLCVVYCSFFAYLIKRLDYRNAVLKIFFGEVNADKRS